jgi:hypothetical protein
MMLEERMREFEVSILNQPLDAIFWTTPSLKEVESTARDLAGMRGWRVIEGRAG